MDTRIHLAELLDEPENGTVLLIRAHGEYTVLQRDDKAAVEHSEFDDERWFAVSELDSDGVTWRAALRYADTVYALGHVLATNL